MAKTRILNEIFLLISATLLFLIGFPFAIILAIPFYILRLTVRNLAKIVRPDLDKMLSIKSSVFSGDFYSLRAPRCSIVVQLVISGTLTVTDIRKLLVHMVNLRSENCKLLYPEFRQYIHKWWGYLFWKNESNFDITNHVKAYQNLNERNSVTREDIRGFMEELLNQRFSKKRKSPWEVYVVNNYIDPDLPKRNEGLDTAKTVLLIRFHHLLCDGYSIVHSMIGGALKTPMSQLQLPTPNLSVQRKNLLQVALTFPFRFIYDLAHSFLAGFPDHPLKIPDSRKCWRQYYSRSRPIPIQKIKEIKNGFDVAFSSVLLSAISSSLTKIVTLYKEKRGVRGDYPADGIFMLPLPLPNHPNALRNHSTFVQINLPLRQYVDSIQRLRECDVRLKRQKSSTVPFVLRVFGPIFGQLPSAIYSKFLYNRSNIGGLTSFPVGSSEIKLGVGNSKIEAFDFIPGAFPGAAGVVLSAITYGDSLRLGVGVEAGLLSRKEVDHLIQLVEDEIDHLHGMLLKSEKTNSNFVVVDMLKPDVIIST